MDKDPGRERRHDGADQRDRRRCGGALQSAGFPAQAVALHERAGEPADRQHQDEREQDGAENGHGADEGQALDCALRHAARDSGERPQVVREILPDPVPELWREHARRGFEEAVGKEFTAAVRDTLRNLVRLDQQRPGEPQGVVVLVQLGLAFLTLTRNLGALGRGFLVGLGAELLQAHPDGFGTGRQLGDDLPRTCRQGLDGLPDGLQRFIRLASPIDSGLGLGKLDADGFQLGPLCRDDRRGRRLIGRRRYRRRRGVRLGHRRRLHAQKDRREQRRRRQQDPHRPRKGSETQHEPPIRH